VLYAVFRPTFLSLNRLKNVAFAIDAFAPFKQGLVKAGNRVPLRNSRLIIGGAYDPELKNT
jgi:hypothetical protein